MPAWPVTTSYNFIITQNKALSNSNRHSFQKNIFPHITALVICVEKVKKNFKKRCLQTFVFVLYYVYWRKMRTTKVDTVFDRISQLLYWAVHVYWMKTRTTTVTLPDDWVVFFFSPKIWIILKFKIYLQICMFMLYFTYNIKRRYSFYRISQLPYWQFELVKNDENHRYVCRRLGGFLLFSEESGS